MTAEQEREAVVREGPAPLPAPTSLHCFGCKHLKTEPWREYMYEDDEWDSGTSARCAAVPTEHGGESISAYWSRTTPVPSWCPVVKAADAIEAGEHIKETSDGGA